MIASLFPVEYNIGYGAYSRSVEGATKEEIEAATQSASLDAFVKRQPEGYQTKVGERGLRLSGGEKQRVAIARAILKQAPIVMYDEATSALDTQTELEIQRELDHVSEGRSSITIAHRLSTIANSDLIIVLDGGVIAEQGTHDGLLAQGGLYSQMWSRQEKAKALEGELKKLTQAQQSKAVVEVIEEGKEEELVGEMLGERKEEVKVDLGHEEGVGERGEVALDVREDVVEEEGEEERAERRKGRKGKKKSGKGGDDDLSAPLLV